MSFVAVLPSIYPLWTERCLATMGPDLHRNLVVVDNTEVNRGVAASWNLGTDEMEERGADWLVIVSAAMRFGPPGGYDFLEHLDTSEALAVEAGHGIGWHLIAFPSHLIEKVGRFDTVFYPGYYEDVDYGRRIQLLYPEVANGPFWQKIPDLDVSMAGFSHGIDLGGAAVDNRALAAQYARKWGGDKGAETFTTPYNLPLPLTFIGEAV